MELFIQTQALDLRRENCIGLHMQQARSRQLSSGTVSVAYGATIDRNRSLAAVCNSARIYCMVSVNLIRQNIANIFAKTRQRHAKGCNPVEL